MGSGAQAGVGGRATMMNESTATRKGRCVIHHAHHLYVLRRGTLSKTVPAAQINARSPTCAQAEVIMARVSAADSTPTLPKPKQIGAFPAAIQDATSSSVSVGNS